MASYNDLNTSKIALVGFVGAFLTFLIIIGLQVLYLSASSELTRERVIEASTTDSDDVLNKQKAKLTRYAWIDAQQGQASIPIERAMELVVEELSASQEEGSNDEA